MSSCVQLHIYLITTSASDTSLDAGGPTKTTSTYHLRMQEASRNNLRIQQVCVQKWLN